MKPRDSFAFALVSLVLFGGAAATARAEASIALREAERVALGIDVAPVAPAATLRTPFSPGRIALPNDRVRVVALPTAGLVAAVEVAVGDRVAPGDVVARVESAELLGLQRAFVEALAERDLARSTHAREHVLAEEGVIAGRRAHAARARREAAEALVEERRHALAIAGTDDETLRALSRTRRLQPSFSLRAPVAGVVLEQLARAGERLEAGAPVHRIGALDVLVVEAHVPVSVAEGLRAGDAFAIEAPAASGRIDAIGSDVHAADQGVLVRGRIDRGADRLRPGQFVRIAFEPAVRDGAVFAIPAAAVVHVGPRALVFRSRPDGFEAVSVDVRGASAAGAVVAGPLAPGDEVAVRGTASLEMLWLERAGTR